MWANDATAVARANRVEMSVFMALLELIGLVAVLLRADGTRAEDGLAGSSVISFVVRGSGGGSRPL